MNHQMAKKIHFHSCDSTGVDQEKLVLAGNSTKHPLVLRHNDLRTAFREIPHTLHKHKIYVQGW
jgi:hypothetical protein